MSDSARPATAHEWQEWRFVGQTLTCCGKCGVVKGVFTPTKACPGKKDLALRVEGGR